MRASNLTMQSFTIRPTCAAAICIALSACNVGYHIPKEIKGDITVTVNNQLDAKICTFSMTPIESPRPSQNWLGTFAMHSDTTGTFHIRPGDYSLFLEGCDKEFRATQRIRVSGPTQVMLGRSSGGAPQGWASATVLVPGNVRLVTHRQAPVTDQGDGEEPASDDPYADRTDCVHDRQPRGNGRCCAPTARNGRNGVWYCGDVPDGQ
jgi:hypothetical protein